MNRITLHFEFRPGVSFSTLPEPYLTALRYQQFEDPRVIDELVPLCWTGENPFRHVDHETGSVLAYQLKRVLEALEDELRIPPEYRD